MVNFDSKSFGENLKKYRKLKEYTQENLAMELGKTTATISRYEKGDQMMSAEDISKVCDLLGIYPSDLFEKDYKNINKENSKNPFKSNVLYAYFYAYDYKTRKYSKGKYILSINERPEFVKVDYYIPGDNRIYLTGYMQADKCVAYISLENYEPNNARLEHVLVEINILNGVDDLMLGTLVGSNSQYMPSIRKCYFSKKEIDFTDELLENLKPTEHELNMLKDTNAMYFDIFNN